MATPSQTLVVNQSRPLVFARQASLSVRVLGALSAQVPHRHGWEQQREQLPKATRTDIHGRVRLAVSQISSQLTHLMKRASRFLGSPSTMSSGWVGVVCSCDWGLVETGLLFGNSVSLAGGER